MIAVDQFPPDDGVQAVTFARDQPEYDPLPALLYPDGTVLTEWAFTDEERALIARGENLRLWIIKGLFTRCSHCNQANPTYLQPVKLELTHEQVA
jgi:hypothetical protein